MSRMRWRLNRFFDVRARFPAARPEVLAFHRSLPGYSPTPLLLLPALGRELGVGGVMVKDESQRFGLNAYKALGSSWAVHKFLQQRDGDVTLACATDGNHGRGVAWAAGQAGKRAVIYVPRHTVSARIEAIRQEGAEVIVVDGTYDDTLRRAYQDSGSNGWHMVSDTAYRGYMEIPAWVTAGYSTMFIEIEAQLGQGGISRPDIVIVQAGAGALAAAAVEHFLGENSALQPTLVCVQSSEADGLIESVSSDDGEVHATKEKQNTMIAGLACGIPSLLAWPVLKRGVTLFVTVEDRFAIDAMRRLYSPADGDPSIVAGEAGSAGLAGLLALCLHPAFAEARDRIGLSPKSSILLINSEGDTDPENFRRVMGIHSSQST
jgi:diaminopropionate ammonia-lyase